jgi:hypothetical protein
MSFPPRPPALLARGQPLAAIAARLGPFDPRARLARFTAVASVPPTDAEVAERAPFRRRLVAALRNLARIEGRVAYEADAMDRQPEAGAVRPDPAADPDAEERLATPRERGR